MKIDMNKIVQAVITALLIATLTAAFQTYIEVKMLRKDVDQLWSEVSDYAQEHDKK